MDSAAEASGSAASAQARPARAGWTQWLQALCMVYAVFAIVQNVGEVIWFWPAPAPLQGGTLGAGLAEPFTPQGFLRVEKVREDGPMARAGVAVGDRVRFDRPYDFQRRMRIGETIGFTLEHQGKRSHREVVTTPRPHVPLELTSELGILYDLATMTAALFGAFIIWRSRNNPTTLLLGMGLVTYGLITPDPQLWLAGPAIYPFVFALGFANLVVISTLFYGFALRFYEDWVGPLKRYEWLCFWAYAAVVAITSLLTGYGRVNAVPTPLVGDATFFGGAILYLGFAVALAYLVLGWRRSTAATQQRYALLLVATAAIMLAQVIDIVAPTNAEGFVQIAHFAANAILTGVIASGLFAYSILRHRVFDLGFAVNRTLVYAVVSSILLAAFGLIEWAVDHFVPIEGRENNALIDAVIAVGVFLTFHRVRDVVEHAIEALFFRRWQKAEAKLRRFVREAAFFTEASALTRAAARAFSEFGEGAQAAVYLQEGPIYRRAAGEVSGLDEVLDANLPMVVALRAEPTAAEVRQDDLHLLLGPMANRNEVAGFAVLGPKASGLGFRPDEIELFGWATHQIGLDLHALEVDRYVAITSELRHENATLRSLIGRQDSPSFS